MFKYRLVLLILGFIGVAVLLRRKMIHFVLPVFTSGLVMYFYFTVVIVHAEMRYLLIPDLLITIFAGTAINEIRVFLIKNSSILSSKFR